MFGIPFSKIETVDVIITEGRTGVPWETVIESITKIYMCVRERDGERNLTCIALFTIKKVRKIKKTTQKRRTLWRLPVLLFGSQCCDV